MAMEMDIDQSPSQSSENLTPWSHINELLSSLAASRGMELGIGQRLGLMSCIHDLPPISLAVVLENWRMGRPVPGASLEELQFFPKPNQLRLAWSLLATGSTSEDAWEFTLLYIRHHGTEGKPRPGKPIYHATKPNFIIAREDDIEAPQIPSTIVYAVERMGGGNLKKGLSYIQQHPYFAGWDGTDWARESPHRVAEVIERRFRLEYEKAAILGK